MIEGNTVRSLMIDATFEEFVSILPDFELNV